jgi:predicted acylesterase/phospholipase RssA
MQSVHPLDFDKVIQSDIPLKVVASSIDSLGPILLTDFKDKDDLVTSLRASATVPEVAGGPVVHRGHRLVDAAVFEAIPFRSAIADGCTHVLVLCTRPPPVRKSLIDQALADAVEVAVKRAVMSPEYMLPVWKAEVETLMKDGLSQDEMLLRSLDEDSEQLPWFAGSHVFPIYPMGRCPSPVCLDVAQLKDGVAEGRRSTMTVMKAILGDVMDFSQFVHEASQIVPLRRYNDNNIVGVKSGKRNGASTSSGSSSSSSASVARMSSAERIMWDSMDTDVSQPTTF